MVDLKDKMLFLKNCCIEHRTRQDYNVQYSPIFSYFHQISYVEKQKGSLHSTMHCGTVLRTCILNIAYDVMLGARATTNVSRPQEQGYLKTHNFPF